MIGKIIELSVRNRFVVFLLVGVLVALGLYCLVRTPIDAIPDLSENQVIVWADWSGRSRPSGLASRSIRTSPSAVTSPDCGS